MCAKCHMGVNGISSHPEHIRPFSLLQLFYLCHLNLLLRLKKKNQKLRCFSETSLVWFVKRSASKCLCVGVWMRMWDIRLALYSSGTIQWSGSRKRNESKQNCMSWNGHWICIQATRRRVHAAFSFYTFPLAMLPFCFYKLHIRRFASPYLLRLPANRIFERPGKFEYE